MLCPGLAAQNLLDSTLLLDRLAGGPPASSQGQDSESGLSVAAAQAQKEDASPALFSSARGTVVFGQAEDAAGVESDATVVVLTLGGSRVTGGDAKKSTLEYGLTLPFATVESADATSRTAGWSLSAASDFGIEGASFGAHGGYRWTRAAGETVWSAVVGAEVGRAVEVGEKVTVSVGASVEHVVPGEGDAATSLQVPVVVIWSPAEQFTARPYAIYGRNLETDDDVLTLGLDLSVVIATGTTLTVGAATERGAEGVEESSTFRLILGRRF